MFVVRIRLVAGRALRQCVRVQPKFGFGFGYGAETDLTYGFGLVSATAKVQWHKFGFGRNITPIHRNRRNCKIDANCNTVAVWELHSVAGQSVAHASWYRRPKTSILLPGLTTCLVMSSVIPGTLRRRLWVVWFYGFSAHASFTSTVVIRWSAVGFGFGYGYGRK